MKKLDPTKLADWQIAEECEKDMKTVNQLAEELGIKNEELMPYGHYFGKIDFEAVLERLKGKSKIINIESDTIVD